MSKKQKEYPQSAQLGLHYAIYESHQPGNK